MNVKMYQDLSAWHVYRADGTEIDISTSITCGLQEAINESVNNGYDLEVQGVGINTVGAPSERSMIVCQTQIHVPPSHMRRIDIKQCTILFTADVLGDGLIIDSAMQSIFNFDCEIAYQGNNAGVVLLPQNALPLDPDKGIKNSKFYFKTIEVIGGSTGNACCRAIAQLNGVCHTDIEFSELRGGSYGFQVCETGQPSDVGFFGNFVRCPHVHYQTTMGTQIGNIGNSNISGNEYHFVFAPAAGAVALALMDKGSIYNVSVLQVEGTPSVGIKLMQQSNGNLIMRGIISAGIPVQDLSGNKNRII